MKSRGLSSTEFWVAIVCMALGTVGSIYGASDMQIASVAGIGSIYIGGRSLVKAKQGH